MVDASLVAVFVTLLFLLAFTVASVHYVADVLGAREDDHGPGGQPS